MTIAHPWRQLLVLLACLGATLVACADAPSVADVPAASQAALASTPAAESTLALTLPEPRPGYALPGDAVFPEGITYQPTTGDFFVNSIVSGTVFRGNIADDTVEVFLPGGQDGRTEVVGMKADRRGRLLMAGGGSGRLYAYDTRDGTLLANLWNGKAARESFLNDLALGPDGTAYITDSFNPVIYRVRPTLTTLEPWLDLSDTVVRYADGFNLNGIAASADGRYLLTVQLNTGQLYRIDIPGKTVTAVDLGGVPLEGGDGLILDGTTLYVVQFFADRIVQVDLDADLLHGRVAASFGERALIRPTTIVKVGQHLLVVNSQFDRRGGILAAPDAIAPELPFTVSSIAIPAAQTVAAAPAAATAAGAAPTTAAPTEAAPATAAVPADAVPAPAQCYVDAVAAEQLEALVGCFRDDAVVIDVSRRIAGADAIRRWADREVIGGRLDVLERTPTAEGIRLLVRFSPPGSTGGFEAYYAFTVADGRIVELALSYA